MRRWQEGWWRGGEAVPLHGLCSTQSYCPREMVCCARCIVAILSWFCSPRRRVFEQPLIAGTDSDSPESTIRRFWAGAEPSLARGSNDYLSKVRTESHPDVARLSGRCSRVACFAEAVSYSGVRLDSALLRRKERARGPQAAPMRVTEAAPKSRCGRLLLVNMPGSRDAWAVFPDDGSAPQTRARHQANRRCGSLVSAYWAGTQGAYATDGKRSTRQAGRRPFLAARGRRWFRPGGRARTGGWG